MPYWLLRPWIAARRRQGVTAGTINHGLQITRRILNLAASEWVDESGLTWLHAAPKIKMLPYQEKRQPYPLSWDEQLRLFQELPRQLAEMATFAVNTGCRDAEVCHLQWEWEVAVPELGTSVFLIPGWRVKNGEDRLVVLNRIARSVIGARRGQHVTHVFAWEGKPVLHTLNTGWKKARSRAGLDGLRVHDLRHTFGRRCVRPASASRIGRTCLATARGGSRRTIRRLTCRVCSRRPTVCVSVTGGRPNWWCYACAAGATHAKFTQAP